MASCSHSTLTVYLRLVFATRVYPTVVSHSYDVGGKTVMIKYLLTSLESQARIAGEEVATTDFVHQCN